MKIIPISYTEVAAALIQLGDKVLIAERSTGSFKGRWEFPGGKLESGETPGACLRREIREELGIELPPLELFSTWTYEYGELQRFRFFGFWCQAPEKSPAPKKGVHSQLHWADETDLSTFDLLEADRMIVPQIQSRLRARG
ncbi:MAG: NUDIX domain-containing protein [Candidatus Sungbacteria bacterium]|nr:NUDIX domain-containing protein [Candidatus Sungbacteria bacterium]